MVFPNCYLSNLAINNRRKIESIIWFMVVFYLGVCFRSYHPSVIFELILTRCHSRQNSVLSGNPYFTICVILDLFNSCKWIPAHPCRMSGITNWVFLSSALMSAYGIKKILKRAKQPSQIGCFFLLNMLFLNLVRLM